jgi:hypothetical protein
VDVEGIDPGILLSERRLADAVLALLDRVSIRSRAPLTDRSRPRTRLAPPSASSLAAQATLLGLFPPTPH